MVNLEIFPNPASDHVSVSFDLLDDKNVSIKMLNVLGQSVKTISKQQLSNGHHDVQLQVNDLSKGIYFLNVDIDGALTTKKVVVE